MAPAVILLEMSDGAFRHGLSIATGSAIMSVLVISRLTLLLRLVERQTEQVRELARRDELTGLPNRRAWTDELPRVLERARQSGLPVSVCMVDLDHFKVYNDTHGHQAGDRLLKEAAAAWLDRLRQSDILARYGGEEFIVLLPSTDLHQACEIMERVRPVTPGAQTFSCGVAAWDATETSERLIARADNALPLTGESSRPPPRPPARCQRGPVDQQPSTAPLRPPNAETLENRCRRYCSPLSSRMALPELYARHIYARLLSVAALGVEMPPRTAPGVRDTALSIRDPWRASSRIRSSSTKSVTSSACM
jgi:diguanylate cyclase (GGDEF)-like protein